MNRVGLVYGDVYLQHKTGPGHPERPERLSAIIGRIKQGGALPDLMANEPCKPDEKWITAVHSVEHLEALRAAAHEASYAGSLDTPVCHESYEVALQATGGVIAAVDAVMARKVLSAFCAVRPPGHHASRDEAMGFCLLNNVAIAARYAQKKHGLAKVLVVDWDVHHGNGTQAIFYEDPSVFFFSVHQWPFYPGTGAARERGAGRGLGTTLNVPLPRASGRREYCRAFEDQLLPAADQFRPELVLISAGFDAHEHDPLGEMKLTADDFAELTRIVKAIAARHCEGRLVSVLEGGYNLEDLAASVEGHLRVLGDDGPA